MRLGAAAASAVGSTGLRRRVSAPAFQADTRKPVTAGVRTGGGVGAGAARKRSRSPRGSGTCTCGDSTDLVPVPGDTARSR